MVPLPLVFSLPPDANWRLQIVARGSGKWRLVDLRQSESIAETVSMEISTVWKKNSLVFHSMENPAIAVEGGAIEIRSMCLRREGRGWWDSQLTFFLSRLLRLDLGVSSSLNQPVMRLIASGIGPSLALTIPIFLVELVVSLCFALICAYRRGTFWDRSLTLTCIVLMSVNYLVWIILGQYFLAYRLGWFPVWGFESWKNLCLPVLVGVMVGLGANVRFYRTILLEEMNKEYVRMAQAKGLSNRRILFKHVLKNAMAPVITNTAMAIPFLYTGSLMLEGFFGIPGLGYLSLNAIHSSDVDVVRAVVLVGAVLCTAANMLADIAYAWVDPRVKLG